MSHLVTLLHKGVHPAIELKRTPLYLRFVVTGGDWRTLDGLDQPEDAPLSTEQVLAARRMFTGTVHVEMVEKGRRVGKWIPSAVYHPTDPQPAEAVLRDTAQWQAWVLAEVAMAKALAESNGVES